MFSGIIQAQSKVVSAELRSGIRHVRVATPSRWRLKTGQSVSINGICSTVVKSTGRMFDVEYMSETLAKTTALGFAQGTLLNLERSLMLKDYVDGHLVAGHVDAKGRVESIDGDFVTVSVPHSILRFIAAKGSIALNGVALTVTSVTDKDFTIALIPYTKAHTNLGAIKVGHELNVEIDMLARYVDSLTKSRKKG